MPYTIPPVFVDDEYLGAYKLRILAANDDYFKGNADRFEMAGPTFQPGANLCIAGFQYFNGYIYLTQGTLKWSYNWSVAGVGTTANAVKLYIDKGLGSEIVLSSQTNSNTYTGSTDVSALTAGLHNVQLEGTWDYEDEGGPWPLGCLHYCHEVYTGAEVYAAPNSFTDGQTSAIADFTKVTGNDLYFRAVEPGNHPFVRVALAAVAGGVPGWSTWFKFRTSCPRMYYKNSDAFDQHVTVGDTAGTHQHCTLTASTEGYVDLTEAFVAGTWYQIAEEAPGGGDIECPTYLGFGPIAAGAGFTPVGEFTPGQFVWGTTANQRTRLELLKENDVNIAAGLAPADYAGARHAVAYIPYGAGGNKQYVPSYYFKHRLPVLSYAGTGITMSWGTANTLTLPAYTGAIGKVDLASINTLMVGQIYRLEGGMSWAYEDLV